ncbi:type I restriction endonuclease subunit M [Vibrio crassostreae]|uniref:type I restriction endonuclease subunit M n=1 Tax=Vibrio crassostreae TaxID=246167 RepID=UPI001B30B947|nr:type I restriction endonuclease subunit M [Vibrio crassostreae]
MNELNVTSSNEQKKEKSYVCSALPFELGVVVCTPGIESLLKNSLGVNLSIYLQRHQSGDWGTVKIEDKILNDEATKKGDRILSSYLLCNEKIWIITEHDRSCTTVLLPHEY